ncbi:MAG: hypothetical protein J5758_07125, partial [Abditibacteriota bacterium]|nr:hypothetical protein [Abditibacteriota bacterium]
MLNIRKVSESTADHYLQALRTVSEMLVGERLVGTDIYEIQDLADLLNAADKITTSQAFVELNTRGHQMYSAGLNHYLSFAKGDLFDTISEQPELIDIPVDPSDSTESTGIGYRRSGIIRDQALSLAGYRCEIDRSHESFVAEASHKPYMEGHHILSMKLQ